MHRQSLEYMERLGRFSKLLFDWFQQMSTNLKTHLSAKLSGAVPVLCETVYEGFLNVMAEYDTGPGKGLMSLPTHVIRILFATRKLNPWKFQNFQF